MSDHHKGHPDYATVGIFAGYEEREHMADKKITLHDILIKINEIRTKYTAPPAGSEVVRRGIDEITAVDAELLDLQERILDDHGNEPQ